MKQILNNFIFVKKHLFPHNKPDGFNSLFFYQSELMPRNDALNISIAYLTQMTSMAGSTINGFEQTLFHQIFWH